MPPVECLSARGRTTGPRWWRVPVPSVRTRTSKGICPCLGLVGALVPFAGVPPFTPPTRHPRTSGSYGTCLGPGPPTCPSPGLGWVARDPESELQKSHVPIVLPCRRDETLEPPPQESPHTTLCETRGVSFCPCLPSKPEFIPSPQEYPLPSHSSNE